MTVDSNWKGEDSLRILKGSNNLTIVQIEEDFFDCYDVISKANKNSLAVPGFVLPKNIIHAWEYRVNGYCGIQFRSAAEGDVRLVQMDERLKPSFLVGQLIPLQFSEMTVRFLHISAGWK